MSECCSGNADEPPYDYSGPTPWVTGEIDTVRGPVPTVATNLTRTDHLGGYGVRWGIKRMEYRVPPGLYAVGSPDDTAPVLVTANYKLTFDALRRELTGVDAWILVLDTKGVNVWCAAGKGTFGTIEVVRRVLATDLAQVVSHRVLVLPQLGAPGVAAHDVRAATGFRVVYGPVRAADVPAFLSAGMKASSEMRLVTFTLRERLVLAPVELAAAFRPRPLLVAAAVMLLAGAGSWGYSLQAVAHRGVFTLDAAIAALLAGGVVTPVLLPWLPGRSFSLKGATVGALAGLGTIVAVAALGIRPNMFGGAAIVLGVTAGASYIAMNFTGSTPFTSPSGVEHEMRRALPFQVGAGALAIVAWVISAFVGVTP